MTRFRTTKTNLRSLGISPRQLGTSPKQLAMLSPAEKKRVLREAKIKITNVRERTMGLVADDLTPASIAKATETLLRQPTPSSVDDVTDESM